MRAREIVVISGKGGTGKTSLTAAFAALAREPVLADCDVDAADLHLVLDPEVRERHEFISGNEAVVREDDCTGCGECREICRYQAVKPVTRGDGVTVSRVDPLGCEGCGVCVRWCRAGAIDFPRRLCGEWYISSTRCGPLVHARLRPAAENSGKLVSIVREQARRIAAESDSELIIVDGPPGIGCPVIASITGADLLVVVTEPTLSGEHDLGRVLQLAGHFKVPVALVVNKYDINPGQAVRIEEQAVAAGARPVGRLDFDPAYTAAQVNGRSVVEDSNGRAVGQVRAAWEAICRMNQPPE